MRITGTVHTPYKINTSSDTNGLTYVRQQKNLNLLGKLTKDYKQHDHIYIILTSKFTFTTTT